MAHTNVEIKARCSDQNRIREILRSRNADFRGTDQQIDTYFKTNFGRLKLREGRIENALIYYEREDEAGPKQANVILFRSDPNSSLKEILTNSLGVLVVVEKQREIYFINNVKFHIDNVKELGAFIEIEAIDSDGTIVREKLLEQCQFFLGLFNISQNDLISISYSDLLLQRLQR